MEITNKEELINLLSSFEEKLTSLEEENKRLSSIISESEPETETETETETEEVKDDIKDEEELDEISKILEL